ncbi:hypothetical protein TNCV_4356831 [Trichonephila clavipes]|nr:hypothetical protein TNCV_4356831 [Trichonephila clavipes]
MGHDCATQKRSEGRMLSIADPEYQPESNWCLLHEYAPGHTSLTVRRFLAKNNACVLNYPLYSPDLAPVTTPSSQNIR